LSPILGLEGYQTILNEMKMNSIPVYAIGGIGLDDIPALMETGIHGIAVSGLITQSEHKKRQSNNLKTTFMEPSLFKIGDKILESLVLGTGKFGSNVPNGRSHSSLSK
jgi:hypothetical protein